MPSEALGNLERVVEAMLSAERLVTPEGIRKLIAQFRDTEATRVDDTDAELLARALEERHNVTLTVGAFLKEPDYKPWLEGELASIDFYYWSRYRRLLQLKHLPKKVVSTINEDTDRVLGLLENPSKAGPWDRRGMVMGHVQSGKTANYIGLISKAADAGYKLIVVIAGVHNNLRNQTQKRIDEGFVGRDSARLLSKKSEDRFIGVGKVDARRRPVTFTNSIKDFSKEMATGLGVPLENLKEPAILVIKKNSNTLKNLLDWLKEHNEERALQTIDEPMLLIDDEADNASINVSYGKDEVSKINGQIRDLLKLFSRSCYVGYTATPFANIFIDPDTDDAMKGADLFPKNFIVSLDAPSNYFGASTVFGDDAADVVRHIDDNELRLPLKHVKDHQLVDLPESLKVAVRTFIVARAIRLARGHEGQHCSMLVNSSRFMAVQAQLRSLIQRMVEDVQASVRLNSALPPKTALRDPEISALHEAWKAEYSDLAETWPDIQTRLLDSVAPIRVVEVNTKSRGNLNYDDYEGTGLSVIAVGGFALSRGLTLEGLMVSYFLRNSMMYDTLMQMGRWFGYRPGYQDLCRVWMLEEAEGWYAHISVSIDELRDELRKMAAANATPEDFGLKVRAHPDTLLVTARNKMGSSERLVVRIGLQNSFIETATLRADGDSLSANRRQAAKLAKALDEIGLGLSTATSVSGGYLKTEVPVEPVMEFVRRFTNHPLSMLTEPAPVTAYIQDRADGELATWDVLFAGIPVDDARITDSSLGMTIGCQSRTAGNKSNSSTLYITNKQRVASRGVEKTGLTPEQVTAAERAFAELNPGQRNFPDKIYREKRSRPLLIVHLLAVLDPKKEEEGGHQTLRYPEPVVGWGISFPETGRPEEPVEYVVTTTWMRENLREDVADEDDSDEL